MNNAPHNVLEAGSLAQPVVPAPVAAAASSGGGMREYAVNLVHGVPGELACSAYGSSSSVSDTVASNMSIVSTHLSSPHLTYPLPPQCISFFLHCSSLCCF